MKPRRQQIRGRGDPATPELEIPGRDGHTVRVRPRKVELPLATRERPRRRLLGPLPLLGAVLVLIALGGYLAVYERSGRKTAVLVAARDLPSGSVLRAADLRTGKLAADSEMMAGLLPAAERSRVLGRTLHTGLVRGAPLPRAALAPSGSTPAAFTLVLPALHALGDGLTPGDRVTVLATFEPAGGQAQTRALARGLEVLAIGQPPARLDPASATLAVTLALPDPSLASALALANSEAKIDLLREGGQGRTAPIPPLTEGQSR